jgi:hypothetical protein
MSQALTVECEVHFDRQERGRKRLAEGAAAPALESGRVPRLARYMALALRLDGLVRSGAIRDYAELARLGRVTRARVTQILNLIYLAPAIQEAVLFLPRTVRGRDPIVLRDLLPIAALADWRKQRKRWAELCASHGQ